jgi:DNA polymerase type B, organellar and viral
VKSDYLTPLTSNIKRKHFATFDLESKDGESQTSPGFTRVFLAGFFDGESFESFRGRDSINDLMLAMLQPKYSGWHIYAHNGGRFDFLHLLPWLAGQGKRLGYNFAAIPAGKSGGIQILDIWKGKGKSKRLRWRLLDSIKLIPLALAKACKTFGLPGKTELPLETHEDSPEWEVYNEQDCRALWSVLGRFHTMVEDNLGGEVGITTPATAMKTWRRKYLPYKINRGEDAHEFVFSTYCGGRTEVFKREASNLNYYDINSSYPAVMREPMPSGPAIWWNGEPPDCFTRADSGYVGFVEADVKLDDYIPCLPVKRDGKLMFPNGRISGRWDWAELSRVKENIVRYGKSVWFRASPLLASMVEDLYPYRDSSLPGYDAGLAYVVKILLNSLYGKFGQSPLRRKVVPWSEDLPEHATPVDGTPDSPVWYVDEEITAPYIMPQIAAHVTALARLKLYDHMVACGESLAYCDTDSIITSSHLDTTTALGGLKNEFPGVTFHGTFLAPKLYMLRGSDGGVKVVAKGIRERTEATFETLRAGGTVSSWELEKLGKLAHKGFSKPEMFELKKSLKLTSFKREWRGNETIPVVFNDW